MKKILIVLLTVLLIIGLMACGGPPKSTEEEMAESLIESMSDEDVDVDIDDDGDKITISSEEGDMTFEGDEDGMAWPGDKIPSNVPELKGVKVVAVIDAGTGIMIAFEDCSENNAEAYVELMKAAGWNITMEMESDGLYMVIADNAKKEMLQFLWSEDDNAGEITYGQQ